MLHETSSYSPNYEYVKEAFAIRAGLVDRCRLFTPEEAASLYRCVDFTRNNCMTLTWEQEQELNALTEKLQFEPAAGRSAAILRAGG